MLFIKRHSLHSQSSTIVIFCDRGLMVEFILVPAEILSYNFHNT